MYDTTSRSRFFALQRSVRAEIRRKLTEIDDLFQRYGLARSARSLRAEILGLYRLAMPDLRPIDIAGIHIAKWFETVLLRLVPIKKRLRREYVDDLHGVAIHMFHALAPEIAVIVIAERETSEENPTRSPQDRFEFAYKTWLHQVYFPLRGESCDEAPNLSGERRELLRTFVTLIRATGAIRTDPTRLAGSAFRAMYPSAGRGRTSPASMRHPKAPRYELINGIMRLLDTVSEGGLGHLRLSADRVLLVSSRAVRDRYGSQLGIKRVRSKRRVVLDSDVDRPESLEGDATVQSFISECVDSREHAELLASLREFLEVPGYAEEVAIARSIADAAIARSTPMSREDSQTLGAVLKSYVTRTAKIESPELRAAVAYSLFSERFTRKDLATRFGCTERTLVTRAKEATVIAREIHDVAA